jgi:hypothetical protein
LKKGRRKNSKRNRLLKTFLIGKKQKATKPELKAI